MLNNQLDLLRNGLISAESAKLGQRKQSRPEPRISAQKTARASQESGHRNTSNISKKESYPGIDPSKLVAEEEREGYSAKMKLKKALYPATDSATKKNRRYAGSSNANASINDPSNNGLSKSSAHLS